MRNLEIYIPEIQAKIPLVSNGFWCSGVATTSVDGNILQHAHTRNVAAQHNKLPISLPSHT